MPELPHLILPRAEVDLVRRKRPGFGRPVPRDPGQQFQRIRQAVDEALAVHKQLRVSIADPELIVRVRTTNVIPEEEWIRAGLTVLGHDDDGSVVLFSSDAELTAFRERLRAYSERIPDGQKNPQYAVLIGSIEELRPLEPRDRIGSALRREGFESHESFAEDRQFVVDAELWEVGTQLERVTQTDALTRQIAERGGEVTDQYIGHSFTALRIAGTGRLLRWLLTLPLMRVLDLPPEVDADVQELLETTIANLGTIEPPDEDAPLIGILDSGVNNAHPLLEGVVANRLGVPATLGVSDGFGHGSKVSGIAAYGDVRGCIEAGTFQAAARLLSGKVLNDNGRFDDRKLIPSQMDEIVRALNRQGCRIFNVSLGDRRTRYSGGKVGTWTAILDELARDLDILFVVAAGNYEHLTANGHAEDHLLGYPGYLLTPESRILEPGPAANALTVGAVAQEAALPDQGPGNVGLRPIARVGEPAPFTRGGPGINDATKPDLCDDGGNLLFDGITQGCVRRAESEVFTTHPRYLERLFTTERGTSCAAPLVAYKAALVLQAFPNASANLIRALLASSARVPEPSLQRLTSLGDDAVARLCGLGIADAVVASTSDTNRVVLYADARDANAQIRMDRFFVYEIPITPEFAQTSGIRHIRVTLAYDAPTRHSRAVYLGVGMSFRLVRGRTLDEVIEHYRSRNTKTEGPAPKQDEKFCCKFEPGPNTRECGTLQSAVFTMKNNPAPEYGETYYLVVRCERGWFQDEFATQRFAVVVELEHSADIRLYQRVRERVEVRVRA
jgi:hypothetical protein